MAGILKRFSDIMSANVNSLLDKAEDPAKMIDQYIRNLESDLGKVKAETAAVMAEETRTKRELDECAEEIEKLQNYAQKAVLAGNDNDAKAFLVKKQQWTEKKASLSTTYELAAQNAAKMKAMHQKLVSDISELDARRDAIKAKLSVARTQERLNQIGSSVTGSSDNLSAFNKMEARVDKMLDEANAMAELNASSKEDNIDDLMNKYDTPVQSGVEDELEALKKQMGR